jgi:hypothetical protein
MVQVAAVFKSRRLTLYPAHREIIHVVDATEAAGLPRVSEVIDWVAYVRRRCPECEGEWR